jgi:signal transduction histidine kinase
MSRNRYRSFRVTACLLAVLRSYLALGSPSHAQDQTIAQMVHTSWTGKDGAPQSINALAQTPDGTLWIGSSAGLFSFDGLKFTPFDPRSGSRSLAGRTIRSLFVTKDGDLWIFFFHGPPARIHHETARLYEQAENEQINVLNEGQQDADGNIWAVLNWRFLVRMGSDNIWHKVGNPTKGMEQISRVFIDSSDTMWVIADDLVYRRSKNDSTFAATDIHVYGPAKFCESRDHTLWVIGQRTPPATASLQHINSSGQRIFAPRVNGQLSDIALGSDDSIWIQTDLGLRRLRKDEIDPEPYSRSEPAPDLFELRTGVSDVQVQALLRDGDGNIWVGGMGGLDRFEHANLVSAIVPSHIDIWLACVGAQGDVWASTGDGHLFSIRNGKATQILKGGGGTNLFCGTRARGYLIQDAGISVVSGSQVRHLPLLPWHARYGDQYLFLGLLEDRDGGLIAGVGGSAGHGLWRYAQGKWSRFLEDLDLPEVCGMLDDGPDRLYLAFTQPDDRIGKVSAGILKTQSVPIRTLGFAHSSYGVIAYGAKGIAVETTGVFQTLSFAHPEHATMVTGVVEARNGDLWLMGARGVVRVPASEISAAIANPVHAVSSVNFQEGDFVGPDMTLLFRHSADIDPSGRLWFSTLNGVVSIDPDHLVAPEHPPLLSIRSIVADGHEMDANAAFPADTRTLNVHYFGLDLTDPRRVVYRYRLEGQGSDSRESSWQGVGSQTEATYSRLRPGSYRFQVQASNGNDVWTQPVSSVTFRILPHLYERPWVQGIILLSGIFLAWFAISLRVRYLSAAIRIRAEERADERIKIARELHDTLLQGVQGLLLSFHVASQKVPADHVSKKALEKALTTADRIIEEGRNRVNRLRAENLNDAELKSLIEGVAANLNAARPIDVVVERKGKSTTLYSHVVDEVFCIVREALTNAFRHSGASRIVIDLDYQKREFRMSCRDNGCGFDADAFYARQTNGHWGLRGMKERAQSMGAKLSLTSTAHKGTEVHITLPARLAYVRYRRFGDFLKRRTAV